MVEATRMVSQSSEMIPKPRRCVISVAGALAGGPNNLNTDTALKAKFGEENVMVLNSVSTRYAGEREGIQLTIDNYHKNIYYDQLAKEAIEKFKDVEDFNILCTSGGGEESFRLAAALLKHDEMKGKKIHFLFFGVPGFAEKGQGILRLADFSVRLAKMFKLNRELNQQSDFYPLPDEYLRAYPEAEFPTDDVPSGKAKTVYEDKPEARAARRDRFFTYYLKDRDEHEVQVIWETLNAYDKQIKDLVGRIQIIQDERYKARAEKELGEIIKQRAKLVFTEGNKWYGARVQEFDEKYKEGMEGMSKWEQRTKKFTDDVKVGAIVAIYFSRIAKSVSVGMERKLAKLIQDATKKNVIIDASFLVAGRDEIVKTSDIAWANERLDKAGVQDEVLGWLFYEAISHEAMDNNARNIVQGAAEAIH